MKAVDDVSFFIRKGETLGIVGESGCGKTTCGRTCIGILGRTDGHVLYKGKDVHSLRGKERKEFTKEVQIIFQDPYSSLDPKMKVGDIIAEGLKAHHMCKSREEEQARVKELLETVGLNAEHATRYVHEFSGGQRQRIMIAIALACQPRLLIADEPTTALDVTIQADIIDLLKDIQKEFGMAVIMITHDLGIVANIAKKIIVMYAGKVVETGTDDKWGPVVAIEDASGRIWRVCGTTDARVKKGDTVSAGQTIGKVGSVSCECAEESHIHLEVMEGEKYLDPIKAMK